MTQSTPIAGIGYLSQPGDFAENQAGELAAGQREMLKQRQRGHGVSGVVATILIAVVTVIFAAVVGFVSVGHISLMLVLFCAPPLVLTGIDFRRFGADIQGSAVHTVRGDLVLDRRGFVMVGEVSLHISRAEEAILRAYANQPCSVYFTPQAKVLLAIAPNA